MPNTFKSLGALLAAAVLTTSTASAFPQSVTAGSNFTLDFNGFYDASQINIPGLSAMVTLSAFSFTNTTLSGNAVTRVDFNYSIFNDSVAPVVTSRVSNFAFNTTPNVLTGAPNFVTGVFDTVVASGNQPNGIGTIEMCFTDQGCPGGGSGGVTKGNTDGGTARLYFAGTISQFDIDTAVVRYQSVTCITGSVCNGSASGIVAEDGGNVPEPGTWAMLSGGLALLGAFRRARA